MMDWLQHSAVRERSASSPATIGLLLLALVATLYFASDLLVPIAFAILFNLLLSPLVQWLVRRRVPAALGAGLLVIAMIAIMVFTLAKLAGPANQWLDDAPKTVRELQQQMTAAKGNLANIQELADEVDQLSAKDSQQAVQKVEVNGPGVIESVVGGLPAVASFAGIVVFLTFFLLASGDNLLRRMTSCGRTWSERRRIVTIARQIQSDLSRYLATVTVINAGLGIAVAITMYFLDVPNPLLWGVMAYLLNFAPYVGALASAAVLTLVGLMTFDSLATAMTVPAAFLCLTIVEGQLLTPSILGRRMSLSPIVVFLAVVFWGWLWGIAGALMAVPIVTSIKVVCDHVPGMHHVSSFLRSTPAGPKPPATSKLARPAAAHGAGSIDRELVQFNLRKDDV